MIQVWHHIQQTLRAGNTAILFLVTADQGSSPGKKGFKMSLAADGTSQGTIGGGVMEHNLCAKALELLQTGQDWNREILQTHHRNAPAMQQSGMICAGSQSLIICTLKPQDLEQVNALLNAELEGTGGYLCIHNHQLSFSQVLQARPDLYQEPIGNPDRVHIIGGGHVGLALCRTLALLDFEVQVYDNRQNLATLDQITSPKIMTPYQQLGSLIGQGPHQFVVIVTTGWLSDAEALYQMIGRDLAYLGLMGSRSKIRTIFQELRDRGVSQEDLAKVRAPIGIPIKNRTPAEIGISIAAELIDVRNRRREE